ncbi:MAG: hypothetical protein K0S71_2962 [Clostridia bacterium]|jgi:hypothetical protein|nr:hypothetical protein [Clostridia bacterium]
MLSTDDYFLQYSRDLDLKDINNFAMKESFEILLEEVDYFFHTKERLVDVFIEGIDYSTISPRSLQERFYKVLYSPKELDYFISRLEVKIQRELARAQTQINFKLNLDVHKVFNLEGSFLNIYEAGRTYAASCSTAKAIDWALKKSSSNTIPKSLRKMSTRFKFGEHVLSSVGCSPSELRCTLSEKIKKQIRCILKQNKNDMMYLIKNEIITQVLESEKLKCTLIIDIDKPKTA